MPRLFVAIDVTREVAVEMRRLRGIIQPLLAAAPVPPRLTWVHDDRAHLTVRFLGEVTDTAVGEVQAALHRPFDTPAFDIVWNAIGAFPHGRAPRALWLGASRVPAELMEIATRVDDRLQPIAGRGEARPFTPHLTLARVKDRGRGIQWPGVLAAALPRPITMRVDRVTLYRSQLSSGAPTYTAIGGAALRTS